MNVSGRKRKAEDDVGFMQLPTLVYEWDEGVSQEDIDEGYESYHRVTADMLLPGPTAIDQVKCWVTDTKDAIEGTYTPPSVFLNNIAKRE